MTAAPVESRPWPRRHWWIAMLLFVAAQLGLIFWLGDRSSTTPRQPATKANLLLVSAWTNELAEVNDPTLFVWANRQGFSGAAWSRIPTQNFQLPDRTELPRLLTLPAGEPGGALHSLAETNPASTFPVAEKLEPHASPAELLPPPTSLAARSSLRVEGELAARQLLAVPELSSRTNIDLVGSSVVQVMVDGDGHTISATLLATSGDREADRCALDMAKRARFNSLRVSGPDRWMEKEAPLMWGRLIFDWHTAPMLPANAPPPTP